MAVRPTLSAPASGQQGWDTRLNDNFTKIVGGAFPIYLAATVAALLAVNAANFENCLAATEDTDEVWMSNGAAWHVVGRCSHENCNGARGWRFTVITDVTLNANPKTLAGAFPAGSIGRVASFRVSTLITSGDGANGWHAGTVADDDRYVAAGAFAAGTTKTPADATGVIGDGAAAAGDIVFLATTGGAPGGTFSGGVIRTVRSYVLLTAPTS